MQTRDYSIAKRGLGTAFTESEVPIQYALRYRNRFANAAGGAEKRRGIIYSGNQIAGSPNLTGIHEYTTGSDSASRFVSGGGAIYSYDGSSYSQVFNGFTTAARIRSYQFDKRLVFYNGYDRAVYTEDGSSFSELKPLIEEGIVGGSASATALTDPDITDWSLTDVTVGDLVFNITRAGYGVVTAVTSTRVSHTHISAAMTGLGGGSGDQATGDQYKVFDQIELNIVTTDTVADNVATMTTGTTTTTIAVSADKIPDWTNTEARIGDLVYNTTRAAISNISDITASSIVISPAIAGQTAGDSAVLYKSAMPIPKIAHVHYGRVYNVDQRNAKRIIISGANDIEDYTVDSVTQTSVTLNIGGQQPSAEPVVALATFQNYLMVGTHKNVYAYRGTDPADLAPAGLFPQGVVSPDAFVNTGNDLAFVAPDGLLSVSLLLNTNNLQRSNLSEPIRTTLRPLIREVSEGDIQCYNYPRRSWLIVKIGGRWFVYNYTNFVLEDGRLAAGASWSEFDGLLCQQNAYLVDFDYDLIAVGANGRVYEFDTSAVYSDVSGRYSTEYQTGWLTLEEPNKTVRMKSGVYIAPEFEVGGPVVYTIEAVGNYDVESIDSVTTSAESFGSQIGTATIGTAVIGGGKASSVKLPLRWRGEKVRITVRTDDTTGPDVLAGFTLYGNIHGVR